MKKYSDDSMYISAYAKLPADMPSGGIYKAVDVGIVFNSISGEIEDAAFTLITSEAVSFLKQIIVGYNIYDKPIDDLLCRIKARYLGASQRAICVALKLIYERCNDWRKENAK
jgi:hypothetical protein